MSVDQKNTYVIGSNNDLSNALLNIDLNRIGDDLTYLENDGGTLKVSVGSLIEAEGSLYAVSAAAVTPTGTAQDGAYLFFDPATPGFVWSNTPGTFDPERGGIYDGSDRRQCRFRLKSATTWDMLVFPESPDVAFEGDVEIEGDVLVGGELTSDIAIVNGGNGKSPLKLRSIEIGTWNMDTTQFIDKTTAQLGLSSLSDFVAMVSVTIRKDDDLEWTPLDIVGDSWWVVNFTGGFIRFLRANGGFYDTVAFDTMGDDGNRGWITYLYKG